MGKFRPRFFFFSKSPADFPFSTPFQTPSLVSREVHLASSDRDSFGTNTLGQPQMSLSSSSRFPFPQKTARLLCDHLSPFVWAIPSCLAGLLYHLFQVSEGVCKSARKTAGGHYHETNSAKVPFAKKCMDLAKRPQDAFFRAAENFLPKNSAFSQVQKQKTSGEGCQVRGKVVGKGRAAGLFLVLATLSFLPLPLSFLFQPNSKTQNGPGLGSGGITRRTWWDDAGGVE